MKRDGRSLLAHAGHPGNELADSLAKRAAVDDQIQISFSRVPISYVKKLVRAKGMSLWEKEWAETESAASTKRFFPKIGDRMQVDLEHTHISTMALTGHGKNRAYLHRFHLLEDAVCPCGNPEQT